MDESIIDWAYFVNNPAIVETLVDVLLCTVPIWLAIMIGLVIGWAWRPRWTGLVFLGLRPKLRFVWTLPPGFGARRLWLACTALSAFSVGRTVWSRLKENDKASAATAPVPEPSTAGPVLALEGRGINSKVKIGFSETDENVVTENDLEHLLHLINVKDGELAWQSLMERSTSNMTYQAWRHEPESGPVVYRSRTIFEDAPAELVRDFFWDDEFRPKWDPMLSYFKILKECPHTGAMINHWIKKFPFFCSDREYIIGRRIWEAGKAYYCVTKGVPHADLPRRDKPRRVDHYFSSWVIKPVVSRKGDGQSMSACEVTFVHYEDMGIPKDVAKLGVRHGMWGTVKKLHSGLRAYQHARKTEMSLSRCALMARITTKISCEDPSERVSSGEEEEEEKCQTMAKMKTKEFEWNKNTGGIDWKWVAVGGTVALVCGLHSGVIGKALLLGAGHRAARR